MTTTSAVPLMTADELALLPDDGQVYELDAGRLICMSPSVVNPGAVAGEVLGAIREFARPRKLGRYGSAEAGFRLSTNPDTVYAPDVWFIRAERIPPSGLPFTFFPGPPDLAVEVLSPSDRFVNVTRKVRNYLEAGATLVWVLDPQGRSAAAFHADGRTTLIDEDGFLDGDDVLPGFRLSLREAFDG